MYAKIICRYNKSGKNKMKVLDILDPEKIHLIDETFS